jgi:hypothetical protein
VDLPVLIDRFVTLSYKNFNQLGERIQFQRNNKCWYYEDCIALKRETVRFCKMQILAFIIF